MCNQMKVKHKWFWCGGGGVVVMLFLCGIALCRSKVEVRDEGEHIVLRNERVTVVLSKPDKGAIVSITDNDTGQEFIAKQSEPCLFRLVFTKKDDVSGRTETFSSRDAQEMKYSMRKRKKRLYSHT